MSANTFFLQIIATDKVFFKGPCQKLIIPLLDGEKEVLPHHEDMVIAVTIGEMRLMNESGEWINGVVGDGFVQIINNRWILRNVLRILTRGVPRRPGRGPRSSSDRVRASRNIRISRRRWRGRWRG